MIRSGNSYHDTDEGIVPQLSIYAIDVADSRLVILANRNVYLAVGIPAAQYDWPLTVVPG